MRVHRRNNSVMSSRNADSEYKPKIINHIDFDHQSVSSPKLNNTQTNIRSMTHNSFYEHNSSQIENVTSPFKKIPKTSELESSQMPNPKAEIDPELQQGDNEKFEQPSAKDQDEKTEIAGKTADREYQR